MIELYETGYRIDHMFIPEIYIKEDGKEIYFSNNFLSVIEFLEEKYSELSKELVTTKGLGWQVIENKMSDIGFIIKELKGNNEDNL